MVLMDRVFGIPDIFGSCVSTGGGCTSLQGGGAIATPSSFPTPFQKAFHEMLGFYSYGLFMIGVFIIIYFIIAIVTETAATGSPFGERFNKTWFPVRIILFFALLIPIGSGGHEGINAAQFLTFRLAKGGSNFASNAWENFNTDVRGAELAGKYDLIAEPNMPELDSFPQFMFLAKTCKITEEALRTEKDDRFGADGIEAYIVRPSPLIFSGGTTEPNAIKLSDTSFSDAVSFVDYGTIQIVFGSHMTDADKPFYNKHARVTGNVWPVCGGISMDISAVANPDRAPYKIQELYYTMIKDLWKNTEITKHAKCLFDKNVDSVTGTNPACTENADTSFMISQIKKIRQTFSTNMRTNIIDEAATVSRWNVPPELLERGWGGAAIWYNQIAELNGAITGATFNLPTVVKYPYVMEYVALQKKKEEENPDSTTIFEPIIKGNKPTLFYEPQDTIIAPVLYNAYERFHVKSSYTGSVDAGLHPFLDGINAIFGINGIYDMLKNPNISPLAQLSALGKGIMDASIRNIGVGEIGSIVGKIIGQNPIGIGTSTAAGFLSTVGTMTIAMGFTLYFILPLMPFIYFFFGVCSWIKSIFEAIVAMPLWALAHITRWDGEGLPGPSATNGYMLLLEIFLRPILILFGLIASISIFSAMVVVLNDNFSLVIRAVGGFNTEAEATGTITDLQNILRGPIDELFFTAVYTVVCYILGLSCFKLIDEIPNRILRYMNFTISTFKENSGDAAKEISGQAYKGVELLTNEVSGGKLAALI
jgi:conjugal transfer/type IV secretion protein DotA/TraY